MQFQMLSLRPQTSPLRYLKLLILSGWHDFCSVHTLRLEATRAEVNECEEYGQRTEEKNKRRGSKTLVKRKPTQQGLEVEIPQSAPYGDEPTAPRSIRDSWKVIEVRVIDISGGSSCVVTADRSWTFSHVKGAVESALGIPHNEQKLVVGEMQPNDTDSVMAVAVIKGTADQPLEVVVIGSRNPITQELWLAQVRSDGLKLRCAEAFRGDREVVLAAVSQNGEALKYADDNLKDDQDVVLVAVQSSGIAVQYASSECIQHHDVALAAVTQNGDALQFLTEASRANRDIVLAAVQQKGSSLHWASQELQNDCDIKSKALEDGSVAA